MIDVIDAWDLGQPVPELTRMPVDPYLRHAPARSWAAEESRLRRRRARAISDIITAQSKIERRGIPIDYRPDEDQCSIWIDYTQTDSWTWNARIEINGAVPVLPLAYILTYLANPWEWRRRSITEQHSTEELGCGVRTGWSTHSIEALDAAERRDFANLYRGAAI